MKNYNKQTGGKIVESGGFGCIFSPPLKCLNTNNNYTSNNNNKISKLILSSC